MGGIDIIGCFFLLLLFDLFKFCLFVGLGFGMVVDVWNEDGELVCGEVGYFVVMKLVFLMMCGFW